MMRHIMMVGLSIVCFACGGYSDLEPERIDYDPDSPEFAGDRVVDPYTGNNATVLQAQSDMRTGYDLHRKVIQRSCSPTEGVCHNQKEYPDMRTTETFLAMVSAPCNVVPKDHTTVYDRCEPTGDSIVFAEEGNGPIEIGYVDFVRGDYVDYRDEGIVPDAQSQGLHFYLQDSITDRENGDDFYGTATLARITTSETGEQTQIAYEQVEGRWWVFEGGTHLMVEVPSYRADRTEALLEVGIRQGDHNRNGIYGRRNGTPVTLLNPGKALESYIIARLRGTMLGDPIPGTRMPLANQPPSLAEMLALACFIEGLPQDGSPASLGWSIDYANCSFNANPDALSLTGTGGPSWNNRIWPLLQANCGGCHSGVAPSGGLDLVGEQTYERLLESSSQLIPFVEPGEPDQSYLWWKLTNAPGISGSPMPIDPPNGWRMLEADELADIEEWISLGALRN